MTQAVDLTNLRSMTDGDKEMEQSLFAEFRASADLSIRMMAHHATDGHDEVWRASAHSLKGIAYNLGAQALGDLCKQAQESPDAPANDKQALLAQINAENARVLAFLDQVTW